jgi:hypothetical protein
LPAGLDLTPQVPDVGVDVGDGDGDGERVGVVEGDGDGDGVPEESHAPRSFHSDGVAAGFQPAPGYAVCATRASYNRPL